MRLLLVAPFIILLLNQKQFYWARHAAVAIFIVMAVSDIIDGVLARKLNAKTRLGAILDPLADKVLITCAAVVLSIPRFQVKDTPLPNWVVVAVVAKDLWVIIGFIVIYLVTDRMRVEPTASGKFCTFGQIMMVGFTLIGPDLNMLVANMGTYIALGTSWVVAGLCVLAGISYTRLGLSFVAKEQKPLDGGEKNDNASD